ncbi:MAG: hypothetical protein PHX61_07755 [Alphaproteobacteria bacterium]|nr:hypothetical protein [Alphaproteobacteria bacterium]
MTTWSSNDIFGFRRKSSPAERARIKEEFRRRGAFSGNSGGETVISLKGWNGRRHTVWKSTLREDGLIKLLGHDARSIKLRWAIECKKTFQGIAPIPEPVSATQMAKKWKVCHVTAKNLILKDWEWEMVGPRHFIHSSNFNECYGFLLKKCLKTENPIASIRAVNKLIGLKILPYKEGLIEIVGQRSFQILMENGILRSVRPLYGKKRMYFLAKR